VPELLVFKSNTALDEGKIGYDDGIKSLKKRNLCSNKGALSPLVRALANLRAKNCLR